MNFSLLLAAFLLQLFFLSRSIFSAPSQDQQTEIGIQFRTDFRREDILEDSSNTNESEQKFDIRRARLLFRGGVAPKTKYLIDYRFRRDDEVNKADDRESLRQFFIVQQYDSSLRFTLGKQLTGIGNIEFIKNPIYIYFFSLASQNYLPKRLSTGFSSDFKNEVVEVKYGFFNQEDTEGLQSFQHRALLKSNLTSNFSTMAASTFISYDSSFDGELDGQQKDSLYYNIGVKYHSKKIDCAIEYNNNRNSFFDPTFSNKSIETYLIDTEFHATEKINLGLKIERSFLADITGASTSFDQLDRVGVFFEFGAIKTNGSFHIAFTNLLRRKENAVNFHQNTFILGYSFLSWRTL